jgi:hypothetical protein
MSGAWAHDWRSLAYQELGKRGFPTMLAFARSWPRATYKELASTLAGDGLAPVQIQKLLEEESTGTLDFRYFVMSSLLRNLHEHLPHGFRRQGDWPLTLALASWAGSMPTDLQAECGRIARRLKTCTAFPDHWLPDSVDDPELCSFFTRSFPPRES